MRYYLANPVLKEMEEKVIDLYVQKKLSREQAVLVLNCMRDSMEQYNSEHAEQSIRRCGRCLKTMDAEMEVCYLGQEIDIMTGESWWSDEIDQEMVFDGLCRECYDLIMKKYFGRKE